MSCLTFLIGLELVLISGWSVAQESAREVKQGDRVALHFTCRLRGGGLAASSRAGAEFRAEVVKSPLFLPRAKGDPVVVLAGHGVTEADVRAPAGLEEEIMRQLAGSIVGVKVGEQRTLEIGITSPTSDPNDYLLPLARVRRRPKELRMPLREFEAQKGTAPTVGMPHTIDPAFPGKVTTITSEEVVVSFSLPPGGQVDTPFGRARLKDVGDHFEMELDAREGTLVRSGPYVGLITEVSEHRIIVDYSHPFGGEVLACDVMVLSASSPAPSTAN